MADFTTAMTSLAEVDDSDVVEYDRQFIIAAADEGVMEQLVSYRKGTPGTSVNFPKYSQLALATTALTDKEDPASEAVADSNIQLSPVEYGNVVTRTQLAQIQTEGKIDMAIPKLVGSNMGRSQDKLAILAAEAGSNELFADDTSEATLTATDVMTKTFLNKLYNKLSRASIAPLSDGMYVAVMHEDVAFDLRDSASAGDWVDLLKYTKPENALRNEIGALGGFKILIDNNVTINADAGASTVDSYHTLCMGFNALGKASGLDPHMVVSGPYDKLNRFVNFGWKGIFKYGIVDTDALWLGTSASSVGAN